MKPALFSLILLFTLLQVAAQNSAVGIDGSVGVINPSFPPTYLRDVFGSKVEPKNYAGIEGTPFLTDDWLLARLRFLGNKITDSILVKLNIYENKLHFKDDKGEEFQASAPIDEIRIIDSNSEWKGVVFIPVAGNKNGFFQVLVDGSVMKLLRKTTANKWEMRTTGGIEKSFVRQEELFLFANGTLYKVNKNCSSLMEAFANDQKIREFITVNDLKCNKEQDLIRLVAYYNSY